MSAKKKKQTIFQSKLFTHTTDKHCVPVLIQNDHSINTITVMIESPSSLLLPLYPGVVMGTCHRWEMTAVWVHRNYSANLATPPPRQMEMLAMLWSHLATSRILLDLLSAKLLPSSFFLHEEAFAIYLCFATSLDNDKAGFRGNLSLLFFFLKNLPQTDLLIQLLICKKSSCFTGLHWCVGTVGTDPSELSLSLLNPYVTHPAVRGGYTRSSLEKS